MIEVLRLEGALCIWDQEGGHASPDIVIDGKSVTCEIEDLFDGLDPGNPQVQGQWRLLLVKVADKTPESRKGADDGKTS